MSPWRTTASLGRAALFAAVGLAFAVLFGDPVMMVISAPVALCAALGLWHRPNENPRVHTRLAHPSLHEGQGTTSRLVLLDVGDVEHVTRVTGPVSYVALRPADGVVGSLLSPAGGPGGPGGPGPGGMADIEVSPRRWGRRLLGEEKVGLSTPWAGYRWGPVLLSGQALLVLPVTVPFDSRAEMPAPLGLVGAHRSRRVGSGTEFSGIRPFQAGDRLRRINWRVSLRAGELHVVNTRSEEDSAVLIVVDALADYGRSQGVDGDASSLDLTVRAAAALAEHHTRHGDRVGLRVVGSSGQVVGYGAGQRHHRRVLGNLASIRPGAPGHLTHPSEERLALPVPPGTVVIVLSPMLSPVLTTAAATLTRRGLPVLVIDTLPPESTVGAPLGTGEGTRPELADLAWRMRRIERDLLLSRLAASGCPVVAWRGPGTLDEVLRRLARRARLPQVSAR